MRPCLAETVLIERPEPMIPASADLRLVACPSPFSTRRIDLTLPAGGTIADMLAMAGVRPGAHARVFVDDWLIPRAWWARVRPRPGRIVTVRVIPAGGDGGGKNILSIVLLIAVAAVAIWVTAGAAAHLLGAAFGTGTFGAAALGAAVGIAGNLAIAALVPPPQQPKLRGLSGGLDAEGISPTITGVRNQALPYGVVPRIYGKHRIFPPLGAVPFTEILGSDQYLRMLFVVGYGPLQISDLKLGDTPIGNFQGVETQIRQGFASDARLSLYSKDVAEDALSIKLTAANSWQVRTAQANANGLSVDVVFPQGLTAIDLHRTQWTVQVDVEYRLVGAGGWTIAGSITATDSRGSIVRRGLRWSVALGHYEVRLRRVTQDTEGVDVTTLRNYFLSLGRLDLVNALDDGRKPMLLDVVFWAALRTIRHTDPISMTGLCKVAIRIKATDQLNGVIDDFNCIAESLLPDWNGSVWVADIATRNPASIYRQILQGAANARPVADGRLDLPGLEAWHVANAAAGRKFDAVIDFRTTVFELLRDVAAVGRAAFGMKDGLYSVVRDVAQTVPIQHFTPRNSMAFTGRKAFPDAVHALKVRFINPAVDWQQDERIVYDDGFSAANATKFEVLELFGVTDPAQAFKDGRYHQAVMRLRPELFELQTDVENLVCTRGDLVRVTHDIPLWGLGFARIKTVQTDGGGNATGVTLDDTVPMSAGKNYSARIRRSVDGVSVLRQVITVAGDQSMLTFTITIPPASIPAVGDLLLFGELGAESVELLVKSIQPGPELTATLTLIDAAPAVHDAEAGPIPAYTSQITLPPIILRRPPVPVIDSVRSDETVLLRGTDGGFESRILVSLHFVSGAVVPAQFIEVRFRETVGAGAYSQIRAEIAGNAVEVSIRPVEDGVMYDVRLRTVGAFGESSEWAEILNHTVVGKTTLPTDVTMLFISGTRLFWAYPVQPLDFAGFHVRARAGTASLWTGATPLHDGILDALEFDVAGLLGAGTQTIMVKAMDVADNESATAAVLTLNLGDPALDNIVFTRDYRAEGYPGTIVNGTIVGSEIRATDDSVLYLPEGSAVYLPDGAALYLPTTYLQLSYAAEVTPQAAHAPADLTVAPTVQGENWYLEFRGRGTKGLYLPIGTDLYLSDGSALYLGGPEAYQPWPGALPVVHATYDVRVTVAAGATQGKVTAFTTTLDVPDIEEVLEDVVLAAAGTRLPITKTYRDIIHVSYALQATGTGALTVKTLDKDPALGPLARAFNTADVGVSATIDARIKGF